MIIAIDGPAGSGKSTLGRMLARSLNLLYIDTGSMYRAVALATLDTALDPTHTEAVTELAQRVDIRLEGDPDSLRVWLEGHEVTDRIREDDITAMSSIVSTIPGVRRALVARQREMGQRGAVMNGRDIGTVVFPDADLKFFLDAAAEERAERRFKEAQLVNPDVTLEQTLAEINERDRRDTTRVDSPLKIADDAIVIDSTGLSIETVLNRMLEYVHRNN